MKFYTLKDAPARPDDVVFRESWIRNLFGFIFSLFVPLIPIGWLTIGGAWHAGRPFTAFLILVTLVFAFGSLLFGKILRRTFRPQNWVLRCRPGGVLIKIRSYMNDHFPEDHEVVVELRPEEIAWIGKTGERRITEGRGSKRGSVHEENITWIEIKPVENDLSELQARLRAEFNAKVSSRFEEYPVHVGQGGVIRIAWRSESTWVTPKAARALETMRGMLRVNLRPEVERSKDLLSDPGEQRAREDMILELAESGDMIGAVKAARRLYSFSLKEARDFVDELMGQEKTAAPANER